MPVIPLVIPVFTGMTRGENDGVWRGWRGAAGMAGAIAWIPVFTGMTRGE